MPDVSTMIYHGVRQNVRRVLEALGPERIEKGLTAFEDGESNWDECFFARAFKGEAHLGHPSTALTEAYPAVVKGRDFIDPSKHICLLLNDPNLRMLVPVKMIWHAFDKMAGQHWTRADLQQFVNDVLDESRPAEVIELIRSMSQSGITEDSLVGTC